MPFVTLYSVTNAFRFWFCSFLFLLINSIHNFSHSVELIERNETRTEMVIHKKENKKKKEKKNKFVDKSKR